MNAIFSLAEMTLIWMSFSAKMLLIIQNSEWVNHTAFV